MSRRAVAGLVAFLASTSQVAWAPPARVRAAAEGFAPMAAPWFHGGRYPRTLAVVTVDGRRPGWSAGVTLREAARLMQALGARDALTSTAEARAL